MTGDLQTKLSFHLGEDKMYCDKSYVRKLMTFFEQTRTPESWKKFYEPKLEKFFFEFLDSPENCEKPFKNIGSYEISSFLNSIGKDTPKQLNYYNAIDAFYKFAYINGDSLDVMKDVIKPVVRIKEPNYIGDSDIEKIKNFIGNSKNEFMDRFLMAFFLYTGLRRDYIFNLLNSQLSEGADNKYYLWIDDIDGPHQIPVNTELRKLIQLYKKQKDSDNPYKKVFNYNETYISTKVASLSKKITGKTYPPQIYSYTFMRKALMYDCDIYSVSQLTLKSPNAIVKHLPTNIKMLEREQKIVDSIYSNSI